MQTIAQQVKDIISDKAGVSLQHGYAIDGVGKRFPFEPGNVISEERGPDHYCTSMAVSYRDGSTLSVEWTESDGAVYTVGQLPVMRTFAISATHVNGSVQTYYVTNAQEPADHECQTFLHWIMGNGVCNYPVEGIKVREIFVRDLSAMYGKGDKPQADKGAE